ncbi:hypothetical protein BDN71DRAFT_1453144 [Pleurotus eryngii]|uniref:Uncharacterized protein n=1 Tax=Pleurotus eryngii TaxID=5323 RepID=A0A9P5ZPP4_PLEER|nr:hypothetical protein BDN71DRAFT_1453144 [Pleurotus eryngii]
MINFPEVLHWTPSAPQFLSPPGGVEIEHLVDGNTRREMLVTGEEPDASRAVYDAYDEAHIAVTRTLSAGTGTVWFTVTRIQSYTSIICLDVRFVVEFRNSEECTRFLHEHMRKLHRSISVTDVAVIDDIMRALVPIRDDHLSGMLSRSSI